MQSPFSSSLAANTTAFNAVSTVWSQAEPFRMMKTLTLLLSGLVPFLSSSSPLQPQHCKPLPGDSHWPSLQQWTDLNTTVGGKLISPPPSGAVCHPTWPEQFNNESCLALRKNWIQSDWHAQNPITSDYNDDTCLPYPELGATCSRDGYPAYTVNASTHEHIACAVKFAAETGVRLVIKGTGHDFPGRYVVSLLFVHECYELC
jgi:hypothetical protein